jgi:hypothetical protein
LLYIWSGQVVGEHFIYDLRDIAVNISTIDFGGFCNGLDFSFGDFGGIIAVEGVGCNYNIRCIKNCPKKCFNL